MNTKSDPVISKIDFAGKDVFEIGSGFGSFSLKHLLHAKSVFGIDTSPEAAAYLTKHWPVAQTDQKAAFQTGDIVDLSLAGKEFDLVVFSNSF